MPRNSRSAAMATGAERRVDPADGGLYTFDEIAEFYRGEFAKKDIRAYWDGECSPAAEPKPKAKAKAKVKAKAKPEKSTRAVASQDDVLKRVGDCKVIPVIKIDDIAHAVPLCKALKEGGIDVAEITFRTECAADAIREVSRQVEGVCVGAGTVLTPQQVDIAVESGADFIVSPGFDSRVAQRCRSRGVLYLPGVITPSEVMVVSGGKFGLKALKFFPASNFGGAGTLKAFAAIFPQVSFMPTGGVTETNIADFVSLPNVFAAGGSWMVADAAVKKAAESGDWSGIAEGARKAGEVARAAATKK